MNEEIESQIENIRNNIAKETSYRSKPIELNNYKLPIRIHTDVDYQKELIKKLDSYLIDIKGRLLVNDEVFNKTQENCNKIKQAIELYYDANISGSKECILKILKSYKNDDYIVSNLDNSSAFRGLTQIFPNPYTDHLAQGELSFFKARIGTDNYNKYDFLHIPFNKRGIITTQRFSIAGVPCMYFGLSSYVCWLELGKPQDREFNVASYKIPSNIKVLNLAISQMLINGLSNIDSLNNKVSSLIEFFPLIIATSFKVMENNRGFRSEYIISQLIMQCFSELEIDSVAYISKQVESDYNTFPFCINLAIPMKNNQGNNYSEFAENVNLTKPINFAEYKNFVRQPSPKYNIASYANLWDDQNLYYINGNIKYNQLLFSKFDDFLFNETHKSIKNK